MRFLQVLGTRIKECREDMGYSQTGLAEILVQRFGEYGIRASQSHIGNMETTKGDKLPSVPMLAALAVTFDTSMDFLAGLTDNPNPPNKSYISDDVRDIQRSTAILSEDGQRRLALIARALVEDDRRPTASSLEDAVALVFSVLQDISPERAASLLSSIGTDFPEVSRRLASRQRVKQRA